MLLYGCWTDTGIKKRIFLAVPLPENLQVGLEKLLEEVPGKKIPAANWHFTVQFFGEVEEFLLERLINVLATIDFGVAFPITLGGLGAFPDEQSAKLLWVGMGAGKDIFIRWVERIRQALFQAGFERDTRPCVPHLTVRRFDSAKEVSIWIETGIKTGNEMLNLQPLSFKVTQLVLYESVLNTGPAQYIALATFGLCTSG